MRHRTRIAALAVASLLPASAALAKEVRYPTAHPEVTLTVPDDWRVAETPLGLELQAPGKDALVLAGIVAGDHRSIDGWSKRALRRMGGEGVVFGKTASSAAPNVAGPELAAAPPKPAAPAPDAPRQPDSSDVARLNGDRPYAFGGKPTVEQPKIASEDLTSAPVAGRAGSVDLPTISSVATVGGNPGAMKPSGHFAYTGGKLHGQPVDVELAVFPLGKDKRLLIEQQSGPTDARGVMIVRSLRDLDLTR